MLKSLHLTDFTVFRDADLRFGKHLNIVIGENGVGKSHILKAAYCAIDVCARAKGPEPITEAGMSTDLARKFLSVFRPRILGHLVWRNGSFRKTTLAFDFDQPDLDLTFSFPTHAKSERHLLIDRLPTQTAHGQPVFFPTRELLTIYPGFVSLYETTYVPFEETWRDTCILLGAPLVRGEREIRAAQLLEPLELVLGGKVIVESGRFLLVFPPPAGWMEIDLVAEGMRKLAMVAQLIGNGTLLDGGYLFWDEPESNLNPRIIKTVAKTILQLADSGVQVFIATHSLFLLRELHILQHTDFPKMDTRCFGLHLGEDGSVRVDQGRTMDDVGNIAVLDEELEQSDRYMETEMRQGKTE